MWQPTEKNSTGYDRWDHICILLLKEGEGKTVKIQPLLANQGCWSLSMKLLPMESRGTAPPSQGWQGKADWKRVKIHVIYDAILSKLG